MVVRARTRVALSVSLVIAFVAHAAVAQEVQWLEYRSGEDLRSMGIVGQKALELSSERPDGVDLPEFESPVAISHGAGRLPVDRA